MKPTNLAIPICLAIINPYVKQMVLFLARVYDLLAAYSGSCILSLLLTLVLSLSGNARLQGCISSSRKEQAFLIVMTVYLLGNVNITSVYYWPIVQLSSVTQSCPTLCNPMDCSTPGLPVHHQLLEPTQLMSIESVMPSNHLILCRPLLPLPQIFPSIRLFSTESVLCTRFPKY